MFRDMVSWLLFAEDGLDDPKQNTVEPISKLKAWLAREVHPRRVVQYIEARGNGSINNNKRTQKRPQEHLLSICVSFDQ